MIIGIDEVGRGPWAGPLCVGAVKLGDADIEGLTDSKKLSLKKRRQFDLLIRQKAQAAALGWVSAGDIDKLGLTASLKLAITRALKQIDVNENDQIIIDGTQNFLIGTDYEKQTTTMKQADLLVPSVSAASILAKVARDNYMNLVDKIFPQYGFKSHVGYGTAAHIKALEDHGSSPLHRLSFGRLKDAKTTAKPTKSSSGQIAEQKAAEFLKAEGYKLIDHNWKTRWCEIDIIVEKDKKVWLVEVKYRSSDRQGSGIDYVTPKKLKQMRFAAKLWIHNHHYSGDIGLAAIEVSGADYEITNFLLDL